MYLSIIESFSAKICPKKKQTCKVFRYVKTSLVNSNISNQYAVAERNKLDALRKTYEIYTPNEKYENFVTAHIKAAKLNGEMDERQCPFQKGNLRITKTTEA